MPDVGVERIIITDKPTGRGSWRFKAARLLHPNATRLYHQIFADLGMSLLPGDCETRVPMEDFRAGYDYGQSIDVWLRFPSGLCAGLQEKFLFTDFKTVTVEYEQNPETGEKGDWFKMGCPYLFVGYCKMEKRPGERVFDDHFWLYVLLDWPELQRETAKGNVDWILRYPQYDGARASFNFAYIDQLPSSCIIAKYEE